MPRLTEKERFELGPKLTDWDMSFHRYLIEQDLVNGKEGLLYVIRFRLEAERRGELKERSRWNRKMAELEAESAEVIGLKTSGPGWRKSKGFDH